MSHQHGCSSTCKNFAFSPLTATAISAAHPHSGTCGAGTVGAGEECGDTNTASGDGCSSICKDEGLNPTSHVHSHATLTAFHDQRHPCSGTCGHGIVGSGEACDDGNIASGDGCSPVFKNEGTEPP